MLQLVAATAVTRALATPAALSGGGAATCLRGLSTLAKALPGGGRALPPAAVAAAAAALECAGLLYRAVTSGGVRLCPDEK